MASGRGVSPAGTNVTPEKPHGNEGLILLASEDKSVSVFDVESMQVCGSLCPCCCCGAPGAGRWLRSKRLHLRSPLVCMCDL